MRPIRATEMPSATHSTFDAARILSFRGFKEENGTLVPIENKELPFSVQRVFFVHSVPGNSVRGEHAHRQCHQLLIAAAGRIDIEIDDGKHRRWFSIASPQEGLWIPPGIWARQKYSDSSAVLMVLCDRGFSESDYIRDYADFLKLKQELQREVA